LARMALYDDDGALARRWRGPATVTLESDPPGARVTAVRYVARGEHLVTEPLDPGAATPIVGLEVPAGSLRFPVAAPGRATVELPVALGRGDEAKLAVSLPPIAAVPDGFVWIPPGDARFGSDEPEEIRAFFNAVPAHAVALDGFAIARHET